MALIKKDGNYMGLPMNIQRGNPIPLDFDAVWYSYDAMAEYARGEGDRGAVAYVGQILTLVDEVNKTSEAYIISNEAGELLPVGSATLGDNKTITLENSVLGLKDFGKKFYKYVEEVTDEETQEIIPAHYEVQEVDETHPWKAGLEPKVVSGAEGFELGWYEPNPTTVEGINAQVAGIQNTVDTLSGDVTQLKDKIGTAAVLDEEGKVTTPASGLYAELDKKASHDEVDSKIAEAVAELDHLKRTTVDSIDDIVLTKEDADQYIYMVPNGDVYDEYMVINGKVELIGNTSVDLSGKVDKQDGYSLVEDSEIEKLKSIAANAEMNIINSVDLSAFGLNDRHLTLNDISIAKITDLQTALDNKVNVEEGSRLITSAEVGKLNDIIDLIKSVNENEFEISDAGQLNLKSVEIQTVAGLQSALDNKVSKEDGKGLSSNDYSTEDKAQVALIPGLQATVSNLNILLNGQEDPETGDVIVSGVIDSISNLQTVTSNLSKKFDNYVTNTIFNNTIADINNDITDLDYRLQWQELS